MKSIDLEKISAEAEAALGPIFRELRAVSEKNTKKILGIFKEHRVSTSHFAATDGYGYDDKGRDTHD